MKSIFIWFGSLPLVWQISIPLSIVIALIIVSLWGGFSIDWTHRAIRIGFRKEKRSCMDCARYIRILQTKADRKISSLENKRLKNKMNHAEHRLLGIKGQILRLYSNRVHDKSITPDGLTGLPRDIRESQECNLFEARLSLVFGLMLDEFRRSFKENGFHELGETEFNVYIQDQQKNLFAIADNYMSANYPRQMIMGYEEFKTELEILRHDLEDVVEDIYRKAKEIELDTEKRIEAVEKQYEDESVEFINSN